MLTLRCHLIKLSFGSLQFWMMTFNVHWCNILLSVAQCNPLVHAATCTVNSTGGFVHKVVKLIFHPRSEVSQWLPTKLQCLCTTSQYPLSIFITQVFQILYMTISCLRLEENTLLHIFVYHSLQSRCLHVYFALHFFLI